MTNDKEKIFKETLLKRIKKEDIYDIVDSSNIMHSSKVMGVYDDAIAEAMIIKVNLEDYGIKETVVNEVEVLIVSKNIGYEMDIEITIIDKSNKKTAINYVNNLKELYKKEMILSYILFPDDVTYSGDKKDLEIIHEIKYFDGIEKGESILGIYNFKGQDIFCTNNDNYGLNMDFLNTKEEFKNAITKFKEQVIYDFNIIIDSDVNDIKLNKKDLKAIERLDISDYLSTGEMLIGNINFEFLVRVQDEGTRNEICYFNVISEDYTKEDIQEDIQNFSDFKTKMILETEILSKNNSISPEPKR